MRRMFVLTVLLSASALVLGLAGCSPQGGSSAVPSTPRADGHAGHDHAEHHADTGESDMDKMKAELAKLSPEDAAAAERQHMCPVSGEMLGTMGAPLKIDVKEQQVWICCEGCKDKLLASPDEYLAKLKR